MAVFLLGLPGSGKSSILRRIAEGYLRAQGDGTAIVRDADEVRVRVPEYGRGDGSQVVQKEVVDVTYGRATAALPRGSHLLIDVVGDPSRLPREVEHFANSGRAIVALCSQVPIEVAVERAKARALSSGRYVSIEYLRSCAGRPQAALHSALATSLVRHWALVDTAGAPTVLDGDGHFGAIGESVRYWP